VARPFRSFTGFLPVTNAQRTIGPGGHLSTQRKFPMTLRLTLLACASTPGMRGGAFPLDEGLDDIGLRDAAALAEEVRPGAKALISPAKRALETATALGLECQIDRSLRDLDLGRWAGHSLASISQSEAGAVESWLTNPAAAPHGGESLTGLADRVSDWMRSISPPSGRILAITHPAVIRASILVALDAGLSSFWHIDVAQLAVAKLTSNGQRWALRSLR
jgi:broad specificity phosphatase PhoE